MTLTAGFPVSFLDCLWRATWQASALVGLVLLAQWAFRKQLTPRWRCALWLLVVARLVLPVSFGSAASVFNWLPRQAAPSASGGTGPRPVSAVVAPNGPDVVQFAFDPNQNSATAARFVPVDAMPTDARVTPASPRAEGGRVVAPSEPPTPAAAPRKPFPRALTLFLAWLGGVLLLAAHVIHTSVRLARRFRKLPALRDPAVLAVLDECRRVMRVRTRPVLAECADVSSPALHGLFRPRLLLPKGFTAAFSAYELRFVFLHELAHVKRRDLPLNWLIAVLQVAHWFNPLLWFGFARWRADRELACDALALDAAGEGQNREYGGTILRLLEGFTHRAAAPGLVGILEDRNQMKRRIGMIARYRKPGRWSSLALVLIAGLGVVTLTDAQAPKAGTKKAAPNENIAVATPNGTQTNASGSSQRKEAPSGSQRSEVGGQKRDQSLATSAAAEWGEPVDGVSVRLRANQQRWGTNEMPVVTFDARNQGQREFMTPQSEGGAIMEVDGTWYEWVGSWSASPFPPGRQYDGTPIRFTSQWRARPEPSARLNSPTLRRPTPQLPPGKHTIRYAVTFRDIHIPVSKALNAATNAEIVVTSNPLEIEIISTSEAPGVVAVQWGDPADGVSVLLYADHFAWTLDDIVTLNASVRNQGQRNLNMAQAQGVGELEVDGVWHQWAGDMSVKSSAFSPGRHYTNLPITLTADWRSKDGKPLKLTAGRHTIRFAAIASAESGGGAPPIRAVSNPVQISVAFGVGERATLVNKLLPGYALRAVRRQAGNQETMVEVLVTPAGEEMDLAAARGQWLGVPSFMPPVGSDRFSLDVAYMRNASLTALAPSLNLKVVTPQDAEEVARLILGLFQGWTSSENWTLKPEPSENGWTVTAEYVGSPAHQVNYLRPLELILEDGTLKDVRQIAGMPPRRANLTINVTIKDANASEPGWGEAVEGLSVRLQADKEVWYLNSDAPALRLSVRNLGGEALAVPESEELGELEVDGIWYTWSDKYFVAHKPLAPGRQMDNLAVLASHPTWRKDSTALFAGAGKHRIRFAVIARRGTSKSGPSIRAVSNPVEVEFRMGVAPREAVAPATNAPASGTRTNAAIPGNGQSAPRTELGAANGGLRLELAVAPNFAAGKEGYDVQLRLLNVTNQAITLRSGWLYDANVGDFKAYMEEAVSIETDPAIAPWEGQVRGSNRQLPQPEYLLKPGEVLTLNWQTAGRRLKNSVTDPLRVQNPEFPTDGLYSVHASVSLNTGAGVVRLTSNEQKVPIGGSRELPKHPYGKLAAVDTQAGTARLGLGAMQNIETGDQFQIRTGMLDFWKLTITRVEGSASEGRLEPLPRIGPNQTNPNPGLPKAGMGASFIPRVVSPPQSGLPPTNALRSRIVFERTVFKQGEPIEAKVFVKNVSDQPVRYDRRDGESASGRRDIENPFLWERFSVLGPDGKQPPEVGGVLGSYVPRWDKYEYPTLEPGQEIIADKARLDRTGYYLGKPGTYRIAWRGTSVGPEEPGKTIRVFANGDIDPGERNRAVEAAKKIAVGLPPANAVEIEVVPAPSGGPDGDLVGRLLGILPDDWIIGREEILAASVTPAGRQSGRGSRLYLGPRRGQGGGLELHVMSERSSELAASPETGKQPAEYLGQSSLGHVYLAKSGDPLSRWSHAAQDIASALGVVGLADALGPRTAADSALEGASTPATQNSIGTPATKTNQLSSTNALRSRIVLERTVFKQSEAIEAKVLVKNVSDKSVRYDLRDVEGAHYVSQRFTVLGPDGQPAPFVGTLAQFNVGPPGRYEFPTLEPGQEIVLDSARLDRPDYYMGKPGKYQVSWRGTSVSPQDPTRVRELRSSTEWNRALREAQGIAVGLPPADPVEIEIVPAPGGGPDGDLVGRVLRTLPPGWRINGADLLADSIKPEGWQAGRGSRLHLFRRNRPLGRQPLLDLFVMVERLAENPTAEAGMMQRAEYLGKGPFGHVYVSPGRDRVLSGGIRSELNALTCWNHAAYDLAATLEVTEPPLKKPTAPDWGRMVGRILDGVVEGQSNASAFGDFCRDAELSTGENGKPLISYESNFVPGGKIKGPSPKESDKPYYQVLLSVRPIGPPGQLVLAAADNSVRWDGESSVRGYRIQRLGVEIVIAVVSDDTEFVRRLNAIMDQAITAVLSGG